MVRLTAIIVSLLGLGACAPAETPPPTPELPVYDAVYQDPDHPEFRLYRQGSTLCGRAGVEGFYRPDLDQTDPELGFVSRYFQVTRAPELFLDHYRTLAAAGNLVNRVDGRGNLVLGILFKDGSALGRLLAGSSVDQPVALGLLIPVPPERFGLSYFSVETPVAGP